MAPKKTPHPLSEEAEAEVLEHQRLEQSALDANIISTVKRLRPSSAKEVAPSAGFLKSSGCDITKKGSTRKTRFLLVFNGLLAPTQTGRLGTLANLDSRNPVMYLDFGASGRVKLFGTMIFPKNKYMLLKPGTMTAKGSGTAAVCEDIFESMIVFSRARFIGNESENPNENNLPWPAELKASLLHPDVIFSGGAGADQDAVAKIKKSVSGKKRQPSAKKSKQASGAVGEGGTQPPASQEGLNMTQDGAPLSQRRSGRNVGKAFNFAEDGEGEGEEGARGGSESPSGSGGEGGGRRGGGGRRSSGLRSPIEILSPDSIQVVEEEEEEIEVQEEEERPAKGRGRAAGGAGAKKKTPVKRKKAYESSESAEESASDEDEEEDWGGGSQPASQRPSRRAAAKQVRYREDSDQDEEGDHDESESEEEEERPKKKRGAAAAKKASAKKAPAKKAPAKKKAKKADSDDFIDDESEEESEEEASDWNEDSD